MNDDYLKSLDKKTLRKTIQDLEKQRNDLLDKLGTSTRLSDEQALNLKQTIIELTQRLNATEANRKHEQNAKEILEVANRNLQEELKLQQSNKNISLILQEFSDRFRNKWHKIFKKS